MTSDAPRALCPICERFNDSAELRTAADLTTVSYRCPRDHLWISQWKASPENAGVAPENTGRCHGDLKSGAYCTECGTYNAEGTDL